MTNIKRKFNKMKSQIIILYFEIKFFINYNICVDGCKSRIKEKGGSPKLPFSLLETMNMIVNSNKIRNYFFILYNLNLMR